MNKSKSHKTNTRLTTTWLNSWCDIGAQSCLENSMELYEQAIVARQGKYGYSLLQSWSCGNLLQWVDRLVCEKLEESFGIIYPVREERNLGISLSQMD